MQNSRKLTDEFIAIITGKVQGQVLVHSVLENVQANTASGTSVTHWLNDTRKKNAHKIRHGCTAWRDCTYKARKLVIIQAKLSVVGRLYFS